MSCVYTSPQNGKAKRIIRTINNVILSLLIQASLCGRYLAEGLHTSTYLLNFSPQRRSMLVVLVSLCLVLHLRMTTYEFWVAHVTLTLPLLLRTSSLLDPPSVFLGYSDDHKGYHCLDLSSNHMLISSSLAMWFLTRTASRSLPCPHPI